MLKNPFLEVTPTAARIFQNLGLSAEAVAEITKAMPRADLITETFKFDRSEFDSYVAYRSVELDNGGVMIADNADFESIFRAERIGAAADKFRFSTEGKIVKQSTRKLP